MLTTNSLIKEIKIKDLKELTQDEVNQVQEALCSIMGFLEEYFRIQDIDYYLGGGSALGAERHQGFIPWDDDLDINMPRKSYNRFLEIVKYDENFLSLFDVCESSLDSHFDLNFTKIKLKKTDYTEFLYKNYDKNGLFIDIFPVENVPNNVVLRALHGVFSTFLLFICSCKRILSKKDLYFSIDAGKKYTRNIKIKCFFGKIFSFMSLNRWLKLSNKVFSCYKNDQSRFVTVPTGRNHYFGEMILRSYVQPYRKLKFENLKLNVANSNDKYLKKLYGDYMCIPDNSHREKHKIVSLNINPKMISKVYNLKKELSENEF